MTEDNEAQRNEKDKKTRRENMKIFLLETLKGLIHQNIRQKSTWSPSYLTSREKVSGGAWILNRPTRVTKNWRQFSMCHRISWRVSIVRVHVRILQFRPYVCPKFTIWSVFMSVFYIFVHGAVRNLQFCPYACPYFTILSKFMSQFYSFVRMPMIDYFTILNKFPTRYIRWCLSLMFVARFLLPQT